MSLKIDFLPILWYNLRVFKKGDIMEKKTIKGIAFALVLSNALTLTGCVTRDKVETEMHEPTAIVEVDDRILGSDNVLYDRTINVYKGTFKPYDHNASAVTFSAAPIYDFSLRTRESSSL